MSSSDELIPMLERIAATPPGKQTLWDTTVAGWVVDELRARDATIAELRAQRDSLIAKWREISPDVTRALDIGQANAATAVSQLTRAEAAEARCAELEKALAEALDEWESDAAYKGEYLMEKHGTTETIAEFRAILKDTPDHA